MKYYLEIENGIIKAIHGCSRLPEGVEEITAERRAELMEVIQNKPEDTLEAIYELSVEGKYVARERVEAEIVDWYVAAVNGGMAMEEVPAEYAEAVAEKVEPVEEVVDQYQAGYEQAVLDMINQGIL